MRLKYFIPDMVYGANDGIISTFAIVAGVVGAQLEVKTILIVGVASLFADGFSMATSNYLASESENTLLKTAGDTDDPFLVNTKPLSSAVATFIAFVVVGAIPLFPYILFYNSGDVFSYTMMATALALLAVGGMRNWVTGKSIIKGSIKVLVIGGVAAGLAFFIGQFISTIV